MKHWVSCKLFTILVTTNADGWITDAAPIARRFIGQRLDNLLRWARSRGGLRHERWE